MNKHLCQNQKTGKELININSKIEDITKASRQGCITDFEEIGMILKDLNETPMSSLNPGNSNTFIYMLERLMNRYELDIRRLGEVKYAEALEFILWIYFSKFFICSKDAYRYDLRYCFVSHLRSMLLLAEERCTALRLFLAVTVKGYITYIAENLGKDPESRDAYFKDFRRNVKNHIGYKITDTTTIKEYLRATEVFQSNSWLPTRPIKDYEDGIRSCCKDLYDFFIADYSYVFGQYFDFCKLEEKYEIKEEDN